MFLEFFSLRELHVISLKKKSTQIYTTTTTVYTHQHQHAPDDQTRWTAVCHWEHNNDDKRLEQGDKVIFLKLQ